MSQGCPDLGCGRRPNKQCLHGCCRNGCQRRGGCPAPGHMPAVRPSTSTTSVAQPSISPPPIPSTHPEVPPPPTIPLVRSSSDDTSNRPVLVNTHARNATSEPPHPTLNGPTPVPKPTRPRVSTSNQPIPNPSQTTHTDITPRFSSHVKDAFQSQFDHQQAIRHAKQRQEAERLEAERRVRQAVNVYVWLQVRLIRFM